MATEETTNRAQRMLYVGGLDAAVTADTLRAAFIPFGELVDVQLPMDYKEGASREGWGAMSGVVRWLLLAAGGGRVHPYPH